MRWTYIILKKSDNSIVWHAGLPSIFERAKDAESLKKRLNAIDGHGWSCS